MHNLLMISFWLPIGAIAFLLSVLVIQFFRWRQSAVVRKYYDHPMYEVRRFSRRANLSSSLKGIRK